MHIRMLRHTHTTHPPIPFPTPTTITTYTQVGFQNAIYHWPAFAGDTITKRFIIRSIRASSNNKYRCAPS